ncbi:S8 family serine peptidase [Streptomyces sp. NPDC056653]|uniref:S8 family serine peptidase n=1 Tax=Streptomyces sp. NPDC056653 TaxID=3345894 RepID=UPI0036ACE070
MGRPGHQGRPGLGPVRRSGRGHRHRQRRLGRPVRHPALVGNYRGNNGDGSFTHDYNWYDPTGQCTTSAPCDNNGHGTHTMGTMVGAGGVGVAPGAKWIAAKGCESSSCSDSSLLAAGQWILAPTDHTGRNPRPDLAPDIVNNSWGGGDTTFYQDIVEAWNAAGIFEAFASGNDGDGVTCSTGHAPGSQAPAYGVGAYDVNGKIASFSGFGPSRLDGSMKPNISAPGVNVRSTWPGNTYRAISGTSMATPHVAGAVALLWSSAPSLIGNIDETRALLNQGAVDVDDTHCGGTADANNVWGEGKLDIFASVDKAPHTAAVVTGKVSDRASGSALSGVTVKASGSASTRTVTTSADGSYRLTLPAGSYDFALSGYGYANGTSSGVTVATGEQVTKDFTMDAVASHAVSGTVLDVTGKPLAKATVQVPTHHLASAVVRFVGGRYEAAHASARRAQEAAEAVRGSERRGLLARSLGSQATALGLAGRFAQARAAADLALPHAEAYGDQELLVTILSVLREHARRSGRLGEAVSIGRQALSLAEHTGDPTTVAFERANLAELHLLLREFAEAREQAEAAVRDGEPSPAWCTPYALAALARVRIRTGEPGAAELLARAGRTAEAQRDRQAVHEVRTADAERLVREGRPQEALTLLADDSDPSAAPLLAWAELLSGHPERAARRAAAETLRAARVGERLSETESRTVHAAALAALGRERAACEEFERAATLARELPYPAGAFAVDEAGGTDWTARSAPPD